MRFLFGQRLRVRIAAGAVALAAVVGMGTLAPAAASSAAESTYIILYTQGASSKNAASAVSGAGGTLVANYQQIGVAIARSSNPGFADAIDATAGVQGAAATGQFGVRIEDATAGPLPGNVPATDSDNLSGLQWDMRQINAPQAHAISGGSPQVVVGGRRHRTGLHPSRPRAQL